VDAVKTEFMTRFLDAYTGQIKDAREKLKAQVEAARARHKTVADRLESFQVQHDIRNVGATVLSQKTDALQTSESALYAEQNKLAGKRRQLASLDESLSGMSATAVTSVRQKNPARESQEARIRGLETELEAMLVKLTPENKRVKDKEAEIERERTRLAEIPEFLSREEQLQNAAYAQLVLDRAKVEGEVKLAEGTIRSLESKIAELKAEVKDNPRITRQYSELREQEDRALGEMQLKERLLAQADNLWDRLRTADSDFFRVLKPAT
jgi:chromosome segregation ATPase